MKKLKKFFVFIIILFLIFFAYQIYIYFTNLKTSQFIGNDFQYLMKTPNIFILLNRLNESNILEAIFESRDMKNTYELILEIKKYLKSSKRNILKFIQFPVSLVIFNNKSSLLIFDTGSKAPLFKLSSFVADKFFSYSINLRIKKINYNNFTIYKLIILAKKEAIYFAQIKNIILLSKKRMNIFKSIDAYKSEENLFYNDNYLQVKSQIGIGKPLSIYFNINSILSSFRENNPKLYKNLKTLSILSIAGANLKLFKSKLKIDNFFSTKIMEKDILKFFQSSPENFEFFKLLSKDTSLFFSLKFDDFFNVWEYYNKILLKTGQKEKSKKLDSIKWKVEKLLGISFKEKFLAWIDDEILVSYFKKSFSPLVFIKIKDIDIFNENLKILKKKNIASTKIIGSFDNFKIYRLKLSSFLKLLMEVFSASYYEPYYVIVNNYIVFSNDDRSLKFCIKSLKSLPLFSNQKLKSIYNEISNGNMLFYWNQSKRKIKFFKNDNLFFRLINRYQYGFLNIKFSDNGIKSKVILTGIYDKNVKLVDGWPIKLDSIVWSKPIVFNIDNKNFKEIFLCTEKGKLFAINYFGEFLPNWPISVDKKIFFSPFIIKDYKNNTSLIGITSSDGEISFFDKNGFKIPFVIKVDANITSTPIIEDLDNNGEMDIIFSDDNGIIYAYNLEGKQLLGFPVQLPEKGIFNIQVFDINNDNKFEIFASLKDKPGNIYLINSFGTINEMKFSTYEENFNMPIIGKFLSKGLNFIQLTKNGNIYCWNLFVKNTNAFFMSLDEVFINPPVLVKVNEEMRLLLITANGELYILNKEREILHKIALNFKPVEGEEILVQNIDKDLQKEILIPDVDGNIHILTLSGSKKYTIKGSITPVVDDIDLDGHKEIITVDDDKNVYLYKFQ